MKIRFTKKAALLVAYSLAALIVLVILTSTTSQAQTTQTETNQKTESAEQQKDNSNKQQKEENYDNLPFMQTKETQTVSNTSSTFGLMLRTAGALLLIVGLIVFAGWGLRKFGGSRFGSANSKEESKLTVLSTVPLGNNRSLAVVRFGERTLLIGSTPQTFTLLASETDDYISDSHPVRSVSELLKTEELHSFDTELVSAKSRMNTSSNMWQEDSSS